MRTKAHRGFLCLCLGLAACSVQRAAAPTMAPATVDERSTSGVPGLSPKDELHYLMGKLEALQVANLGPPGSAGADAALASPGVPGTQRAEAVAAAPPSAKTPVRQGAAESAEPRCDSLCKASSDICGYSRRICELAKDLADADSAASCTKAEQACRQGRSQCQVCRG